MHKRTIGLLAGCFIGCGGGGAGNGNGAVQPVPSVVTSNVTPVVAAPPSRPASVAVWAHVARPAKVGELAAAMSKPGQAPSCEKGDVSACLDLIDATQPVDFAMTAPDEHNAVASAFSVRSVADFTDRAKKAFAKFAEERPGVVRLAADRICDVSAAAASRRVVCGNPRGLADLGPWLRSAPPLSTSGDARVEVYPAVVAFAAKSGDVIRTLANDFGGATLELFTTNGASGDVRLELTTRAKSTDSPWTRALLAPSAAGSPVYPEEFGRLAGTQTAQIFTTGAGPAAALFQLALAADGMDPNKAAIVSTAILDKPVVCAHALDFDASSAALKNARGASVQNKPKADKALDAAFGSYGVCGFVAPIAKTEKLMRDLAALPREPGATTTVRAAGLGLPRAAFVVETVTPKKSALPVDADTKKSKPAKPETTTNRTLFVPDGDVSWAIAGDDLDLTAAFAKRLLARPKSATALDASPGVVAFGSLSSLFGAFTWDLSLRSYDALAASLAAQPGKAVRFVATRSSDAFSLRLEGNVPTISTVVEHVAPIAALAFVGVALAFGDHESSAPSKP